MEPGQVVAVNRRRMLQASAGAGSLSSPATCLPAPAVAAARVVAPSLPLRPGARPGQAAR